MGARPLPRELCPPSRFRLIHLLERRSEDGREGLLTGLDTGLRTCSRLREQNGPAHGSPWLFHSPNTWYK